MHPSAITHPSADSLKAFGLGQLDDASAEAVMSHLDVCPECCRGVANAAGDGFLERLRAAHSRSGTPQAVTKSATANPRPTTNPKRRLLMSASSQACRLS